MPDIHETPEFQAIWSEWLATPRGQHFPDRIWLNEGREWCLFRVIAARGAEIERLKAKVGRLRDEIAWHEGVNSGVRCGFCRCIYSGSDQESAYFEHIETCEKHPLHTARAEIERLKQRESDLVADMEMFGRSLRQLVRRELGMSAPMAGKIADMVRRAWDEAEPSEVKTDA